MNLYKSVDSKALRVQSNKNENDPTARRLAAPFPMNRAFYLAATVLLTAAGFYVGSISGYRSGHFQSALAENKIAILNLDYSVELNPQFREYLKARVYSNVLQFYPADRGYLQQQDWDRGVVNRDILGSIAAAKDPTGAAWDWQSAVSSKHR